MQPWTGRASGIQHCRSFRCWDFGWCQQVRPRHLYSRRTAFSETTAPSRHQVRQGCRHHSVFAALLVAKHAARHISSGPASSITLSTGATSYRPVQDWVIYSSYAAGLKGMARALAFDLRPVRVNVVCLGAVDTDLLQGLVKDLSAEER